MKVSAGLPSTSQSGFSFSEIRVPRAPAPPKTSKLQPGIHCFKSQTCSIRRNFLENSNVSAEHASHGSKVTFYSNKAIEDPKLKIGPHMTLTSYYYPHNIRISATAKQVTTLAVAPHLCHAFQPILLPFPRYPPRSTITRFTLENTYHGWQCTRVKACCIAPRISVIGYNKIPHFILPRTTMPNILLSKFIPHEACLYLVLQFSIIHGSHT